MVCVVKTHTHGGESGGKGEHQARRKLTPSAYQGGNTYQVLATDETTTIRFFYGAKTEINPLINGSNSPKIISSFPVN